MSIKVTFNSMRCSKCGETWSPPPPPKDVDKVIAEHKLVCK